jgi:hypothetical protein
VQEDLRHILGRHFSGRAPSTINQLSKPTRLEQQQVILNLFSYYGAIERSLGRDDVNYAQLTKVFASELNEGRGQYSPPEMVRCEKERLIGMPDVEHISTSYVERQNLTMRMQMRRFTRLTNGFSKKRVNHAVAVALHFAHYNLVRLHRTLRMTPALAHGIVDHLWTVEELVDAALANSN